MTHVKSSLALLLVLIGFSARAEETTEKPASPDARPPGGNGDQFYRVFLSNNDANGDGVLSQDEFQTVSNQRHATPPDSTPAAPPAKPRQNARGRRRRLFRGSEQTL